jgi:hypothetical protein
VRRRSEEGDAVDLGGASSVEDTVELIPALQDLPVALGWRGGGGGR